MAVLRDLIDLSRIGVPYLLHPLTALEVFLPHRWPVSSFTQSASFRPEQDLSSLKGKVILVTGGNGGLGRESIYQLALLSPKRIYLTARSRAKGEAAIQHITERLSKTSELTHPDIVYIELDLSDLQSVKNAATTVLARETRLDILMLNAGIMGTPPSKTKSGHETQLCTNHIGHFLLTKLLLPLLEKTASEVPSSDVRVVTISSVAHHMAPSNFLDMIEDHDVLCTVSPYTAYGISKAANIVFAAELARRYNSRGIMSLSGHPGIVHTDLYIPGILSNFVLKITMPVIGYFLFDDVYHGALNQVWSAAEPRRDALVNGAYYTPVGRFRPNPLTNDETSGERLWNWTTKQVAMYLD